MNRKDELTEKFKRVAKELELEITPEEIEERANKLSEEELEELIKDYQEVVSYKQEEEKLASEIDPDAYAQIVKKYDKESDQAEEQLISNLEKAREELDYELEEIERLQGEELKKGEELEKEIDEEEAETDEIISKITASDKK